jgi:Polysulphide reductase, NrfD
VSAPPERPRDYYGRPIVKEPTWTWEIPWYLFVGGAAGAAAPLAVAAEVADNRVLAKRAWMISTAGVAISPALLVADLGRPERFLNMLRVFKPTSPMSMGSWILFTSGPAFSIGAARALFGWFPRLGRAAAVTSALFGPGLATYTAILLADTAVPVWHEARDHLPWVFAGSAAMSAGALATLVTPASHAGPARRLTIGGALAALIATQRMEEHLGDIGEPYRTGRAGGLIRLAKSLIAGGALAVAAGGRRRPSWTLGGAAALVAGAASERWAVYRAGFASANDPKYVVAPQRRRLAARGGVPSRRNPR